ncbi:LytTR family DNA-binding domain-containing protein [Catenovulum sp. 2E275]|uniref:LytR/AlgR family response regulator transcription factor n=1 Tax=Catenovulum sp. 2E275 TaxID=2980497 RepID=UPI0021CF21AB|nr:LytTR family DNA-binding domain-containing protein [Catenovulum sp. 2E275]MCU4674087.1 LytTR family DNA-binding domain-containing protein [Catenovulum sp. 2E275]
MQAIIVEDSRLARLELKEQLKQFKNIEVIAEAENGVQGVELIEQYHPDIIFLDIDMPEMNGFEMLEQLTYVPTIIFTTAYDEYAIKSFEVNALDYLLKPITLPRLTSAVQKAYTLHHKPIVEDKLHSDSRFFVKEGERCWLVKLQQVQLFESIGNYTRLYFDQHKPMIYKSLSQVEKRLPEQLFFRANRGELINMQYITDVEITLNGNLLIHLQNGKIVELSRRQATLFKKQMSL